MGIGEAWALEPDFENRDPNNINDHLQVAWEDVIGEPDHTKSIDCCWKCSFKCFNVWKALCYTLATTFCSCCIMIGWGCYFACVAFQHVWIITPCIRAYEINVKMFGKIYAVIIQSLGLLTAMAVGAYVYVGKSRLRKKGKEKRRERQAARARGSPSLGGSPRSDGVRYSPLLTSDGDEISLREYDAAEEDSCSNGSSEPEDLLPLIVFSLDLRPHIEKYPLKTKMPFDLFKKKEKKKDVPKKIEPEPEPEPEVKPTVEEQAKEEVKEPVKEEVKEEIKDPKETLEEIALEEPTKEKVNKEIQEVTKDEGDNKEDIVDPISELKTKTEEDSVSLADSGVDLHGNSPEGPKEKEMQKLTLEKTPVTDKEDQKAMICCCIL